MSNESWAPQEEEKLATYIVGQVIGRASGRLEEECLFNMPRDRYFIGSLRSAANNDEEKENSSKREFRNKLAPVAFGAEFLASPQDDELKIEVILRWICYYRIFPTYEQQRVHQRFTTELEEPVKVNTNGKIDENADEDVEERKSRLELENDVRDAKEERRQQQRRRNVLCPRFRSISCQAIGNILLRKKIDGTLEVDVLDLERALETECLRAQQAISKDPDRLRTNHSNLDEIVKVQDSVLTSESKYIDFKMQLKKEIPLSWAWEIQIEPSKVESNPNTDKQRDELIAISFTNVSNMPDGSSTRENFLFDTHAEFRFINSHVRPFTLELAPHGFRYNRNLWGRGFNCAIEKISNSEYRTTHTPRYSQKRYSTRNEPLAPFKKLADNPIPILESIQKAMRESLADWDIDEKEYRQHFGSQWETEYKAEFDRDQTSIFVRD